MAYVKILYQDSPSTATPLNAQNLNHMDDGIAENDRRLNELSTAGVVNTFNSRTGNVTSEKGDYDINQIVASDGQDGYIPVWRNSGTEQEPDWGFEMEEMGGSGHEILDADGTSMAQEDALQFADSFVSDDDVNGRTIVENVKEVDPADYASTTDEGIIVTDDGEDAVIHPSSDDKITVNGDNSKTLGTLLGEIATALDLTKLKPTSFLVHHNADGEDIVYQAGRILSNGIILTNKFVAGNGIVLSAMSITKNSATIYKRIYTSSTGTITYGTSDILTSAESITLYYGNKKATVDLQTTANRCLYDSNTTVKQKIDTINSTLEQEVYEEHTTREGNFVTSNIVDVQNANFLTEGYYTIVKNHKQITVRIAGISSRTNYDDWIIGLKNGYKPAKDEYFTYCLGTSTYHGHVTPEGYIRFHDLNTTDVLSATITFNIA